MFKGLLISFSAIICLSGCVVGQQINMEYVAVPKSQADSGVRVKTVVSDERAEVKNGDKPAWFIGTFRGGFGNTFNVSNNDKQPLAEKFAQDLKAELQSLGYLEATGAQAQKTLDVKINEWSFDGYKNAEFWYALRISVLDASGKSIYSKDIQEHKDIDNPSILVGPKYVVEKELPKFYNSVIHAIVRDNKELLSALK